MRNLFGKTGYAFRWKRLRVCGEYALRPSPAGNRSRATEAHCVHGDRALLSTTTSMQGESVPGVAHAVVIEHRGGKDV